MVADRIARELRLGVLPVGKVCAPFGIERLQAGIVRLQPLLEAVARRGGEIEVPRGGELRNAGFVA